MEKKIDPKGKEKKQTNRKKWYKAVCSLAAAVVVCTVYTLMLPALTLDEESAGDAGVTISESSIPASESPAAAESSPSDNGSESHSDTAADSSADSSPASAESGPAAAAPSADSAPSTNEPATLPSQDGENHTAVTLPAEETNNGAITGSSESQDEVTTPDTDDQEEIKDEESGSPAADSDSADEEDASDPTANVENASIWEATIPDLSDYATWADKLVAVAQSQLGYHESVLNFHVEDGEHKGYTRYGEWYGSPYGDWCAMFVSFCLNYAGIENNDSIIPYNANCQTWVEQLTANKIFEDPDTYLPEPGDIVFFNQEGNRNVAANHVGIVSDVEYGTKTVKRHVVVGTETAVEDSAIALLTYANSLTSEETPAETLEATETEVTVAKSIEVIEGNSSDQVQTVTYDITDDSIIGFASMLEAEYINDGGNIDDIKNTNQINQPVTLEDQIAVQAQSYTIKVGEPKTIGGSYYKSWYAENSNVASVDCNYNGYYYDIKVTGKNIGTTTVRNNYLNSSYTITVEAANTTVNSTLYIYALIPGKNPDATDDADNRWFGLGKTTINLPYTPSQKDGGYKEYTSDSEIRDAISNGVFSEPTGDPRYPDLKYDGKTYKYAADGSENSYKSGYYTITWMRVIVSAGANAGNNGYNDVVNSNTNTFHLDGIITPNNEDYPIVNFKLKDAGESTFKDVDPEKYTARVKKNSKLTPETKYIPTSRESSVYPPTKEVNKVQYKFAGWYLDESCTGEKVDFSNYTITKNTTFYAKYVDCTVNYAVAPGCESYGDLDSIFDNLPDEGNPDGSLATPREGYIFEGWYKNSRCQPEDRVPDDWIDPETGKIIPKRINGTTWEGVQGNTYFAKFTTGVQLPETGAPGTTLIYLLGAMLTTAPLTITFIKRRKQEKEEN